MIRKITNAIQTYGFWTIVKRFKQIACISQLRMMLNRIKLIGWMSAIRKILSKILLRVAQKGQFSKKNLNHSSLAWFRNPIICDIDGHPTTVPHNMLLQMDDKVGGGGESEKKETISGIFKSSTLAIGGTAGISRLIHLEVDKKIDNPEAKVVLKRTGIPKSSDNSNTEQIDSLIQELIIHGVGRIMPPGTSDVPLVRVDVSTRPDSTPSGSENSNGSNNITVRSPGTPDTNAINNNSKPVPSNTNETSTVIARANPESSNTNSLKPAATNTNSLKPAATNTNSSKPAATNTNSSKPATTNTNSSKPVATNTNSSKPVATNTNSSKPAATNTNSSKPAATNTNSSKPTATNTNSSKPAATNSNPSKPATINTRTNANSTKPTNDKPAGNPVATVRNSANNSDSTSKPNRTDKEFKALSSANDGKQPENKNDIKAEVVKIGEKVDGDNKGPKNEEKPGKELGDKKNPKTNNTATDKTNLPPSGVSNDTNKPAKDPNAQDGGTLIAIASKPVLVSAEKRPAMDRPLADGPTIPESGPGNPPSDIPSKPIDDSRNDSKLPRDTIKPPDSSNPRDARPPDTSNPRDLNPLDTTNPRNDDTSKNPNPTPSDATPEVIKEKEEKLADLKKELAQTTDPAKRKELDDKIAALKREIKELRNLLKKKEEELRSLLGKPKTPTDSSTTTPVKPDSKYLRDTTIPTTLSRDPNADNTDNTATPETDPNADNRDATNLLTKSRNRICHGIKRNWPNKHPNSFWNWGCTRKEENGSCCKIKNGTW